MRRNLQRMMVALAAMMICLGASAIDKVVKKSEMKEEVTSVADLANATFMLQSGTGEEAVVLYTPSGWDIKVAPMVTAIAKQDNGGFFKLEALGDHYLIPVFNINKERRTFWAGNQYVNAQPTGNVIFGLAGTNDQHGQDGENLAVWDIAYTEGQGFTFHCYGRDVYIGYDAEAARPSTTPVYWRAYKSYIAGYDVDEVTAAYEAVAAAVKTTAAATALSEAKTAYDSDNDLDKFGDAVNAAIDVVNACVAINATYTNLDTYGAAIATEVLAKYNAGEYANAEELRAAYIVAAKAQRTAGADFTGAIINPGFEYGNTDGWTTVASSDTGARETSNGTYAATGSEGNYLFNTWWKGTPCTQTIAGLPNGTYKLSALVASDGATIYLTANGGHNEGTETGGEHPSSGVFQTAEYEFAVTDGTATIGVVGGADGTAGEHKDYVAEGYWWYKADNFKLTLVALAPTYAVTIADGIENGTVEADPTEAYEGDKVTLTITPAEGYELDALSVKNGEDDVEVAADYTFTMPAAAVTVSATFKEAAPAPTTYAVTIAEGIENGTVEADVAEAAEGTKVTLTIKADDGYELDEISVKNGEDDVEVAADSTFIMPAGAVLVSATFKEKAPEPTLAAVKMTYVSNDSEEGDADKAFGEVTEAKAGYNKIINDNEVGFGNTGWGRNYITYIQVDASSIPGGVVKKATMKADLSGTIDNNKRVAIWGVGYNSSAWSADMTYNTADKSITLIDGATYTTVSKNADTFESAEFDITEAFAEGNKTATILVYETAAAGAIIKNVKVEVEMGDKEIEVDGIIYAIKSDNLIPNGSFDEGLTGWTQAKDFATTITSAGFEIRDEEGHETFLVGTQNEGAGGANSLGTAWGIEAGKTYLYSFDVKSLKQETGAGYLKSSLTNTKGTETESLGEPSVTPGKWTSFQKVFTNDKEYQYLQVKFRWLSGNFGIDNFALYEVEQLSTALDAAKAKALLAIDALTPVGDGVFYYNADEIAAAKAAVEAATTIEEVEAVVMPTAKAPEADKAYTLSLKTSDEASPFNLSISTESGITIAAKGTPVYFVAQEGGKYALSNGTEYVNYAGGDNWTMAATTEAYGWSIAVAEGGYTITGKNGFLGTNTSDGNAAGSSCYGDKNTGNGNVVWTIAEYVAPATYAITIFDGIQNGSVEADATEAEENTIVKLTIKPDENYELKAITISYEEGEGDGAETKYIDMAADSTFQMPAADVTIGAEFAEIPPVDPNDYTAYIVNADLKGEGGFDATGTKGIDGSGIVKGASNAQFDFKQTITLPAGQYKLTAQAAYRYGTGDGAEQIEADAIAAGTETKLATLYATVGEDTETAAVQNRYNGASETDYANGSGSVIVNKMYVPNSSDAVKAWFAAGQYVNEVVFNVFEEGDVTIGIKKDAQPEAGDYTVIGPWTLTRLGDAVAPVVPTFAGIVEQTLSHPQAGVMGTTVSDQTVKIAEAGEGLADITFSGFTLPMAPLGSFPEFTISNVTATTAIDGSITYAAGDFQVAIGGEGQMSSYYNGTLEGVQASAEATPCFKLVLQNATTDEVYFGADKAAIKAYKAALEDLIEIAQDQGTTLDDFTRTAFVEGEDYNTYTASGQLNVAFKMFDIDVKGCDYVTVRFAEPAPKGWYLAFWGKSDTHSVAVPEGATEFIYNWSTYTEYPSAVENDVLPQICMLTLFDQVTYPLEAKVTGVYKHKAPTTKDIEIAVERYPGMGYGVTEATVDFTEAKEFLGVEEITYDMLRIVNPDGTEISDYAPYDGWFNGDGVATTWGENTKICVKFYQAIEGNGAFAICDMNGADEIDASYDVKWALVANDKKVFYNINVKFVEKPVIAITFDDLNQIGDDVVVPFESECGKVYEALTGSVDVAAILGALEVTSLSDVTIYAVQSDGTLDDNYKLGTTDGWRNADGDWQGWGDDARFGVKADFSAEENQIYWVGGMDGQNTEPAKYTATFAFVKNGSETNDAVVLKVTLTYAVPDAIDAIETAEDVKADGKYMENGKLVIIKNGHKYNASGLRIK